MEMEESVLAKLVKSNSDRVKLVNYDGGSCKNISLSKQLIPV